MASNHFGNLFQITTWGESHGKAIGVVIDGCPAGLALSEKEINDELALRSPGRTKYVTPRAEKDKAQILSGVFEGKTTGEPISILIPNKDADSSKYAPIKNLYRPGHSNFTYLEKYGIFDWRGGGRSSARETACRVAAGSIAKKLLKHFKIQTLSYIKEVGGISISEQSPEKITSIRKKKEADPIFCPDTRASKKIRDAIENAKEEGDSLGGIIEFIATGLPVGLGDPVYEKLEANLAKAMMSLPATKGFEIGSGFAATRMKGSEHNDQFILKGGKVTEETNFAGGTLGGISTSMPLIFRVAFKPTSSIVKPQKTVSLKKKAAKFQLPKGSRHDPCVTIRAVPIVDAMGALVLADALLMNRSSQL